MVQYDWIWYDKASEVPDLGGLQSTIDKDDRRHYMGISSDANKLPTVAAYPQYKDTLLNGSSFFAMDTQAVQFYYQKTDSWF